MAGEGREHSRPYESAIVTLLPSTTTASATRWNPEHRGTRKGRIAASAQQYCVFSDRRIRRARLYHHLLPSYLRCHARRASGKRTRNGKMLQWRRSWCLLLQREGGGELHATEQPRPDRRACRMMCRWNVRRDATGHSPAPRQASELASERTSKRASSRSRDFLLAGRPALPCPARPSTPSCGPGEQSTLCQLGTKAAGRRRPGRRKTSGCKIGCNKPPFPLPPALRNPFSGLSFRL